MSSDESDESDKGEYDKTGSESGSSDTLGTGLGGLLRVVVFPLGVKISSYESCDGDWGSLAVP